MDGVCGRVSSARPVAAGARTRTTRGRFLHRELLASGLPSGRSSVCRASDAPSNTRGTRVGTFTTVTIDWDWTRVVFDHVQVTVSDAAASVAFYRTVLATLEIPPLWENERGAQFANLVV